MNTNKIIEKAKESYDRYFKDAPVFPENHEQDVVCPVSYTHLTLPTKA